ncbi:pilus assembly protein [Methylobacterium sp. J-078]|jgi:Flp pilus assembly protein TadG|uniref:TadE/TadG family type IV pilus assembly protein n=1 Tax=Methylobacterium sp. J-078 TaxID=2836657 RepID=UPI001FBA64DE|nr:TadE/TadG family type IV pilus assembly protein [Methylobacterium sp. J-078]MCJ2044806.1 pilus assembly protein [Methylobacterium sp. J-078]
MPRLSLTHFGRDRRGLAIVEFAVIAPVMILLSCVSVDLVRYIFFLRKVELAASTMADLVARNDTGKITQADILSISKTQLVIFPEAMKAARDGGTSVWSLLRWSLSGVQFRTLPTCTSQCTYIPTVSWTSGQKRPCLVPLQAAPNTATPSPTTLPSDTFGPGFLVVADIVYTYKPLIAQSVVGSIDIAKSFYFAPRYVSAIAFDPSGGSTSAFACPLS